MRARLRVSVLTLFFFLTFSCFSFFIFNAPACAQFYDQASPTFSEYLANLDDGGTNTTVQHYADQPLDTAPKTQQPTVALFKSLLVPGLGQIGNKKYVKAGIIIAAESALIATLVHYAIETSDARDRFDAAVEEEEKTRLFQEFKDAKDKRNQFSWYTATVVFLSMFDAFVDAHLARFPKYDDKVSIEMAPGEEQDLAVMLTYRF